MLVVVNGYEYLVHDFGEMLACEHDFRFFKNSLKDYTYGSINSFITRIRIIKKVILDCAYAMFVLGCRCFGL